MFDPVYAERGDLRGFSCRECGKVTRTQTGMIMHCRRVHEKVAQRELFDGSEKPIRDARRKSHNDGRCPGCGAVTAIGGYCENCAGELSKVRPAGDEIIETPGDEVLRVMRRTIRRR